MVELTKPNLHTHLIVPDTQVRVGDDLSYLDWIGKYIVDKKPDVVVQLGDFADMKSLSSYDEGKKANEGARYEEDIKVAREAMGRLLGPLNKYNRKLSKNKKALYKPRLVMTLGNHEDRITRHVNNYPVLYGKLSVDDLGFKEMGWEVHPFLETVEIDGVVYSHFFPRGPNGRIMQNKRGAPSARAQAQRQGGSCTSGHLQGLDYCPLPVGGGIHHGLIAGSCYTHEEEYLTPQGTDYWRGIIVKHEVRKGQYAPMFVTLDYLKRRYG